MFWGNIDPKKLMSVISRETIVERIVFSVTQG
jgi:hypothetical protein